MHNDFYASGFLYHHRTAQILLQQENSADKDSQWSLFGSEGKKKETVKDAFKRVVKGSLKIELSDKTIFPVYEYFHKELGKNYCISYAKITKLEKFSPTKKTNFGWFSFKQIQKLNVSEDTKHDLIVSQRVILSAVRKSNGEQTIG